MAKQVHHNQSRKKLYRVRNWSEYNEGLKQRGSLTVWVADAVLKRWQALPSGKRGAQPIYTDFAITLTLQLGIVFGQRLRQTEGLAQSLFLLLKLNLRVPDYSTMSRRGKTTKARPPRRAAVNNREEGLVLVADSSGLKVYGEGEWKVRQHGLSKRRTWRKIHVSVTPDGEIRAAELTKNSVVEHEVVKDLLNCEHEPVGRFIGDGAYDKRRVYDLCQERGVGQIIIPPRANARIWQHGNSLAPPHPRDRHIRQIRLSSLKQWKERTGYHTRSLAETTIFRFKTIFGDRLHARLLPQQQLEVKIKASILNRMMNLGMPDSSLVTCSC